MTDFQRLDSTDIVRLDDRGWLVIGWFTPDYKALADKFAANLDAHGAPYHLFAVPKRKGGWDTRRKPSAVLVAMALYPGKTLVLMDVDCSVAGDIEPVTRINADVGVNAKPRWGRKDRIVLTLSSRVVVFKSSPGAQAFAKEWEAVCGRAKSVADEPSMAWAYISRPDVAYAQIDPRYAGREIGVKTDVDGIVIWHSSEHNKDRWLNPFKWFERRFLRTGRTKAASQQKMG